MLTCLSSIVKVSFKWRVFSLLPLITLFIIKRSYPSKSISKLSMQSLKGFPWSIPKAYNAATPWSFQLFFVRVQVYNLHGKKNIGHSILNHNLYMKRSSTIVTYCHYYNIEKKTEKGNSGSFGGQFWFVSSNKSFNEAFCLRVWINLASRAKFISSIKINNINLIWFCLYR